MDEWRPLNGNVFLSEDVEVEESGFALATGIPDNHHQQTKLCRVLNLSEEAAAHGLNVGDVVLVGAYAGVKHKDIRVVKFCDVLGVKS